MLCVLTPSISTDSISTFCTDSRNNLSLVKSASLLKSISPNERNGFKTEGRRKKYYENNGEDALIMWKILDAPQK